MGTTGPPNHKKVLKILVDHHVDFIVVGGICAVLNGDPITTMDTEVVHSRNPENLDRLLTALTSIDAHYRFHPKKIAPTISLLGASPGHHLFATTEGPVDVLGTIDENLDYDDLLPFTFVMTVGEMQIRLLTLDKLIELKEKTGRDKDKAVLAVLRRTLEERTKGNPGETPELHGVSEREAPTAGQPEPQRRGWTHIRAPIRGVVATGEVARS